MIERFQERRLRRAAGRYLIFQGTEDAAKILRADDMFDAFIDECLAEQSKACEGPISDLIDKLIQSFIDDPQKWIAIIATIIKLFS